MDTLEGRVALVTGASRGIGAAIARSLHDAGVRLGLASRSGADLDLPDVVAQPADVRDAAALKAIADATAERFGGIDILWSTRGSAPMVRSSTYRRTRRTRWSTSTSRAPSTPCGLVSPTSFGASTPTW